MPTPRLLLALPLAACAGPQQPAVDDLFPDALRFAVEHSIHVPVPAGSRTVRLWMPLPPGVQAASGVTRAIEVRRGRDSRGDEEHQTIFDQRVVAPAGWLMGRDQHGNRFVYVAVDVPHGDLDVSVSFEVERREVHVDAAPTRPLSATELRHYEPWLRPDLDDDPTTTAILAARLRAEVDGPWAIARALWAWSLEPGRAPVAPDDLGAQWTALARSSQIPVRTVHGTLLPPSDTELLEAEDASWSEAWFPDLGWVPVDVARAVAHRRALAAAAQPGAAPAAPILGCRPEERCADYYFANLDSRRVTWSQGRDLRLEPASARRVDCIVGAYVEIDGATFPTWQRTLRCRELRR